MLFALPLLVILSPVVVLVLAWQEYRSATIHRQFVRRHGENVRGLLIYSNSPNWQAYIEREWLPRIEGRLFVMNWSQRARWDREYPLEAKIFRELGPREFNPAVIVIRPLAAGQLLRGWLSAIRALDLGGILAPYEGQSDIVRFFQAFRDFKHGRTHTLNEAERRLWELLDESDSSRDVV